MAHRTAATARQLNPTMRIVVRTRYISDVEELTHAGVDLVIAEELESIVQLFGEVLRDYRIAAAKIENYEELARQDGYAALLELNPQANNFAFPCETTKECLDSRTVVIREAMPIADKSLAELNLFENFGIKLHSIKTGGQLLETIPPDFILKPGDEVVLSASTAAFAKSSALFRAPSATQKNPARQENQSSSGFSTEKEIVFVPQVDDSVCSHLKQIRPVFPSANGCEDCLRTGDSWVHLRICLSCGHVGCCDSSKNKHATKHFQDTTHPLIKSLEPGEDWAWCFRDEAYL
jgi:CPA2 family monovalent cation:H+ antiporter-2